MAHTYSYRADSKDHDEVKRIFSCYVNVDAY